MNHVTGEFSFDYIWNTSLSERKREAVLSRWFDYCKWVHRKSESRNCLTRSEIDRSMVKFMDGLVINVGVSQPMLVMMNLASMHPMDRSETSDNVHVRIIETYGILATYKECLFYKNQLERRGYNGPPRNLWEERNGLDSSTARFEFSKGELHVRGLLR